MDEGAGIGSHAGSESGYTDEEIEHLIYCKKRVIKAPRKKMRNVRGCLRNEMTAESVAEGRHFHVFMRQNETFHENFSIGLVFCQVMVARRYGLYGSTAFMCIQRSRMLLSHLIGTRLFTFIRRKSRVYRRALGRISSHLRPIVTRLSKRPRRSFSERST